MNTYEMVRGSTLKVGQYFTINGELYIVNSFGGGSPNVQGAVNLTTGAQIDHRDLLVYPTVCVPVYVYDPYLN